MEPRSVRGMKDLYGVEAEKYNFLIDQSMKIGRQYGYKIIETPILEYTEIFQRSIGDETDVVAKEMYTFCDKGGESVTLRPEGTAGVIRSMITEKMTQTFPLKLMYYGPMFRYDRPQKNRYRQFHQIGFENVGEKTPYVDALTITLASDILNSLGIFDFAMLVNTLGDEETKDLYTKAIVKYFSRHEANLSEDSKRRLTKNPLRILDSKDQTDREICSMAPIMRDYLSKDAGVYFNKVCKLLEEYGVSYKLDYFLVRGLDYYSHTAFEISTTKRSMGSIGGGGRYDKLLSNLGGPDISGVGFAFGAERVMSLINNARLPSCNRVKFAVIPVSDQENDIAFKIIKGLYNASITAELITSGSISKKMRVADKLGCEIALIIGETEKANETVTVKFMRSDNSETKSMAIPMNGIFKFAAYNSYR